MTSNNTEKKTLKRIAHHLDCVVTVGDKGLTENVLAETERALADHELIKVRITSSDREERLAVGEKIAASCQAEVVQRIGKVVVLFRANPKANVKLSNLHRFSGGA